MRQASITVNSHVIDIHCVTAVLYLVLGESVILNLPPTPLNNGFLLCYRLDNGITIENKSI